MSNVIELADYRMDGLLPNLKSTQISLGEIIGEIGNRITNSALMTFYTALTLDPRSTIGKEVDQQYSEFVHHDPLPEPKGQIAQWLWSRKRTHEHRDCDLYVAMRTREGRYLQFEFYGIADDTPIDGVVAYTKLDDKLMDWYQGRVPLFTKLNVRTLRKTLSTMTQSHHIVATVDSLTSEIQIRFTDYEHARVVISKCQHPF